MTSAQFVFWFRRWPSADLRRSCVEPPLRTVAPLATSQQSSARQLGISPRLCDAHMPHFPRLYPCSRLHSLGLSPWRCLCVGAEFRPPQWSPAKSRSVKSCWRRREAKHSCPYCRRLDRERAYQAPFFPLDRYFDLPSSNSGQYADVLRPSSDNLRCHQVIRCVSRTNSSHYSFLPHVWAAPLIDLFLIATQIAPHLAISVFCLSLWEQGVGNPLPKSMLVVRASNFRICEAEFQGVFGCVSGFIHWWP